MVELISTYIAIVENKAVTFEVNEKKAAAWEMITADFNNNFPFKPKRNADQLRVI